MGNKIDSFELKIIITKTFSKEYEKILNINSIENVIKKIKNKLENNLIYLKRPFLKVKFKIENIHIRLIGKYVEDRFLLLPILIYKKSDKKNGGNIVWDKFKNKILKKLSKLEADLKNGDFQVY